MSEQIDKQSKRSHLQNLTEALQSGTLLKVRLMLNTLHPAEIAHLLESMPPEQREVVWELVDRENDGEVLLHVNDEVRAGLIRDMETDELVAATEGLDTDDLADIIQDLPGVVSSEVVQSMDKQHRLRLEAVLSYPEDSAGGLMNLDTVTVRADVTLDVVLRYMRLRGEIPELTDSLIVVDRFDTYLGLLPLSSLLTQDATATVAEVMESDIEAIWANMPATGVASLFEHRDLISAPVVDETGKLLGRITVDDVVDVIRDEADHTVMSRAGLSGEEDMFAPVIASSRRRAVWLGVNLLTAFLASWVIGLFEATLERVVTLAVLMPIVASMGGIAGSQTLTLIIRGIALEQIGESNARWIMLRELAVAALNGLLWSLVVAGVVVLWFQDVVIGFIIAAALIINLLSGAFAGFAIPLLLRRVGIDPALAGTVMLTTITDVVGFIAFLGLGSLFLL
ncbi:magnesium transporter [Solemya pervernicosa gill symbiont]|uniref:Magnesium transporter MgtE n=2 Tax=Gammaproteobacteria incertae sedis TaxID=118884 RepID=A0A1T2L6Z8_9GAMM|nr:magnesium transporter [Candidatus Reidiella endopervernicosa]OOZ40885.1 magnesium transporter [Solemya pervernicosa gill symbiont]QKQ26146.1 magnesium transporter [Candidatus Reidiella endopervernicosa]